MCEYQGCGMKFSLMNRKHHCRKCGHIFCQAHSNQKLPLDANGQPTILGGSMQRVCDNCYAEVSSQVGGGPPPAAAPAPMTSQTSGGSMSNPNFRVSESSSQSSPSKQLPNPPGRPPREPGKLTSQHSNLGRAVSMAPRPQVNASASDSKLSTFPPPGGQQAPPNTITPYSNEPVIATSELLAMRTTVSYKTSAGVNDLVLLDEVTNEGIVKCLSDHYKVDEIYTYIGNTLISVNPFKEISGLYGPAAIKKYVNKKEHQNYPHIYAVAERAYRTMVFDLQSECVIISGESGAGKTEASKKIMEYVAAMSSKNKRVQEVKEQLLQSNPLLEAFGNAKTVRNDNSSRFGKYMEIQFNLGDPKGGRITVFLLEKSRIVNQQKDERCFHVFYQMLSGASGAERSKYHLKDLSTYRYLTQSGCTSVATIDDRADFEHTKKAMSTIGLQAGQQEDIFLLLSGILSLGNIQFQGKGSSSVITSTQDLETAAACLRVPADGLARALTNKTMTTVNESINVPLNDEQAQYARDSLAKSIYGRLFEHIVAAANTAIKTAEASTSIGVLDIYGFEIFGTNGFEQLCINFVNERLHQLFIELTLKAEQEEYAAEGIQWIKINYYNNKPICELIERRGGVFSLLDEECIFPRGTDTSFHEKMVRQMRAQEISFPAQSKCLFMIQHYAGQVTYTTTGILDKNKDLLFPDLVQLMSRSSSDIASGLFQKDAAADDKRRPITTCVQFKNSVTALMETLAQCHQHYVRCIKPNELKRGGMFDEPLVMTQVKYLGLLENVKVRRAGYAFRSPMDRFLSKYKCVAKKHFDWQPNARVGVEELLKDVGITDYELGKEKVFIRSPKSIFQLEEARNNFITSMASLIHESHHDDIIFADKVYGFDAKCQRSPLTVAIAAQGVHVFQGKKLLHRAPMEDFSGITLSSDDGWMVLHMVFKTPQGKDKNAPVVSEEFVYLVENVYKAELEAVLHVLQVCNVNFQLGYSSTVPFAAKDPQEASRQKIQAESVDNQKCTIL
eukprot:CAMPEP_0177646040 /NCGR_PEP_ID=MMETSP0447-20121125/9564_1 /TAXON_ID=0 /ORGANISM="Stygamoeba regulata, Strain BSH-02190019" /LENGTH=1013 /DNA_ID=CAMNT_0019148551 /DNA_START=85 /DNA_END=3126 /DNA_ORIENTATION=+